MSKKNTARKKLNETGYSGAMGISYCEDKMLIDFRINYDPLGINVPESFSEKTVLGFVTRSYADSCITLLDKMRKYKDAKTNTSKDYCAYRYLPAMFCFRHYLELKLKFLYLYYHNESFDTSCHSLKGLLEDLKKNSTFLSDVFDEPIAYISELEKFEPNGKVEASCLRYLISNDFKCKEHLEIPMFELDKIKNFILRIEQTTGLMLTTKLLTFVEKERRR